VRLLNSLSPVHFSTEICGNPSNTDIREYSLLAANILSKEDW
jgi:hypothetical protein